MMRKGQGRLKLIILILFCWLPSLAAGQIRGESFRRYEAGMQKAALAWQSKDLTLSMDILKKCREELKKTMPVPADSFAWQGYTALRTYTLLFSRIVERELYILNEESALAGIAASQIENWHAVLLEQSRHWYANEISADEDIEFRKRWLYRFRAILKESEPILSEM